MTRQEKILKRKLNKKEKHKLKIIGDRHVASSSSSKGIENGESSDKPSSITTANVEVSSNLSEGSEKLPGSKAGAVSILSDKTFCGLAEALGSGGISEATLKGISDMGFTHMGVATRYARTF